MKKYYLKNEEVKVGDIIGITFSKCFNLKEEGTILKVSLSEELLKQLVKNNIIEEVEEFPIDPSFYVNKVVNKLGSIAFYHNLLNHYPYILASILLKEIAIEIDKQYEGHIKDSSEIYVINLMAGNIMKVNKETIVNYRNFAAFRTEEDALIARSIIKGLLNSLYAE